MSGALLLFRQTSKGRTITSKLCATCINRPKTSLNMIRLDGDTVKHTILFFLWSEYLWELYLSIRQYKKALNTTDVPGELKSTMTVETFAKARAYTLAKSKFGFIKDTFSIVISTIVIVYGVLGLVWNYADSVTATRGGEVLTSCLWLFILTTLSTIIDLPLTIYNTFILEEKFGFNKQTGGFFIWDKVKSFILNQVITMMISSVVIVTIKNGGDYFFIWLWLVVCVITLVLLTIYPSVIAPLFDTYTPLPEGGLRTEIEALAAQLEFPLTQLYVVEGSKRSSHSNAYFYGLFKSKRIVLFDTLLAKDGKGCNNEEILAVLSHELGHWYYGHVIKNLILVQINLYLLFVGFAVLFKYRPIYTAFGFSQVQPVLVGLLIVIQYVMLPYNTLLSFLMTCLSRRFEFQADSFAVKLGKSKPLKSALIQLNQDNLGFPIYDVLYSAWHHSHPPLLERIQVLQPQLKND